MAAKAPALVVVNYASHALLSRNLVAVPGEICVVVVDNYSSRAEREAVAALCRDRAWQLVPMCDNRGFGAAVNAGVQCAIEHGCDTAILLNPDARASAPVLRELAAHAGHEPCALVVPMIEDGSGRVVFEGVDLVLHTGRMLRTTHSEPSAGHQLWLTAACLAVHIELFCRLGGFDEDYFLYWEDVDFSIRAARAGAQLVVRRDLSAVHDEGGTQGERRDRAKSNLYYFYNCRNRLLFASKHLDRRGIARWLLSTPSASWEILMRGGRRQLLRSPRPLVAAITGTLLGVAPCLRALCRRPSREYSS
jgi:GT2 family glycosyltransferase